MEIVRFWFRPHSGTAQELAARVVAAGHRQVVIRDGLVGLVPFELSGDAWGWADRMQRHFDAQLVESA